MSIGDHYTDGRRWSHISHAWIFTESWNQAEEIAYLQYELTSRTTTLAKCEKNLIEKCIEIGQLKAKYGQTD